MQNDLIILGNLKGGHALTVKRYKNVRRQIFVLIVSGGT